MARKNDRTGERRGKDSLLTMTGWKRLFMRRVVSSANKVDFVAMVKKIANTKSGQPWAEYFQDLPVVIEDRSILVDKTVELTAKQLEADGVDFNRIDLAAIADDITTMYDHEIYLDAAPAVLLLMQHLFTHQQNKNLFISPDRRELGHVDELTDYRDQGLPVLYLSNHSSHLDEFIIDAVLNEQKIGLPFIAAGANMMAIKSLAKLLMVGSYKVQRAGAGRAQLASLFNHCRALSELGLMQAIFLEAWRGGARSRDGSLRYPRRLVTLQGALAHEGDMVIQPLAISYSMIPEDLPLADRKGPMSWVRGLFNWKTPFKMIRHPKTGMWLSAEGIFNRAYMTMPKPVLLSELKARNDADKGGMDLDEYVSLYGIREIARTKKVMASQLVARAYQSAIRTGETDLVAALAKEKDRLIEYHRSTFDQDPDLEDFILQNEDKTVLEDGLDTLKGRGIIYRFKKKPFGLPAIKSQAGLAFYATHGDRRLYSPTAKENIVVVGAGDWGFALTHLVGNRMLEEKRFFNASMTLYDFREKLIDDMVIDRRPQGVFEDYRLPKNAFLTSDPTSAFRKASEIILAIGPEYIEHAVKDILEYSEQGLSLVLAGWGFDAATGKLQYQIVKDLVDEMERTDVEVYVLAGPVLDKHLMAPDPVEGVLAGPPKEMKRLTGLFNWQPFSINAVDDPMGVQVAQVMSKVYGLWGGYLIKQGRIKGSLEVGLYMTKVTAEVILLAQALGGKAETFSAASVAWAASFAADGLSGPYTRFGRKVADKAGKKGDTAAIAAKLYEQWFENDKSIRVYHDLKSAFQVATELGLDMPILTEACQTIWGE